MKRRRIRKIGKEEEEKEKKEEEEEDEKKETKKIVLNNKLGSNLEIAGCHSFAKCKYILIMTPSHRTFTCQ